MKVTHPLSGVAAASRHWETARVFPYFRADWVRALLSKL
jgi:hypothetical protein